MMSRDDSIPIQPSGSNKDDSQKTVANRPTAEPQRCPRCDSPNTKFCYYNNYNLSQPRYFCKTCRRYWTKGGALRNIPIGGGCRKNKKIYSKSSSSNSRFASDSLDSAGSSSYLDHIGGFKFSNLGLSSAMNFHTVDSNFAKIISPIPHYQQFSTASSFGNISRSLPSTSCFGLHSPSGDSSGTFMGFNFPLSSSPGLKQNYGNVQVLQDHHDIKKNDIVASSIESLSSINQDLHWKLQQERLGMMMFDGENDIMNTKVASSRSSEIFHPEMTNVPQKPQPILFENLEISSRVKDHDVHQAVGDFRKDNNNGSLATEWFFDQNSNYSPVENPTQTNSNNTGITGINQAWCNFN